MADLRRYGAVALLVGTVALVASPLLRDPRQDSYPLSTYPMFASPRERVVPYTTAVGIDPDGEERFLWPGALAVTDAPVQAAVTVARAVRAGDAPRYCTQVAARVADRGFVAVEVITAWWDAVDYFGGRTEPERRTVHARCAVPPTAEP